MRGIASITQPCRVGEPSDRQLAAYFACHLAADWYAAADLLMICKHSAAVADCRPACSGPPIGLLRAQGD